MKKGIDIFSGTVITNWAQLKANGVEYAYIKVTDGKTYTNDKLDAQYKGAKSVGMLVGGYHFAEANAVQDEYNHFMSVMNKYKWDLKPCLDYEPKVTNMAFVKLFMAQNSSLILYAPHSVADRSGLPLNKIWIAEPNTSPTTTREYAGIQYNWTGRIGGLSGDCDIDLFGNDVLIGNNGSSNDISFTSVSTAKAFIGARCLELQKDLILLGYNCGNGKADGDFGSGTLTSLLLFQKNNGLVQDGLAGTTTFTKLTTLIANKTKPISNVVQPVQPTIRQFPITMTANIENVGIVSTKGNNLCTIGTIGRSLRLEMFSMTIQDVDFTYSIHEQSLGDEPMQSEGSALGTIGVSKRIEGITITVTSIPTGYKLQYRGNIQNKGMTAWQESNTLLGTKGLGLRLEEIEVRVIAI